MLVKRVVRDRIELSTFRYSGAIEPCLTVAGSRLTGYLPAPTVSRRRPVSLGSICVGSPDPAGGKSAGYIFLASPKGRPMPGNWPCRRGLAGPGLTLLLCRDLLI